MIRIAALGLVAWLATSCLAAAQSYQGGDMALGGGENAQIRIEVFNVFNRVATQGFSSVSVGQSAFGQIAAPLNFMRMTQVMFRLSR
jgi:hypothetical protein